jgi:amino acid adenylation domain-containing protein/non-ribosomal peptide synthase protein (TIGR01720 family)
VDPVLGSRRIDPDRDVAATVERLEVEFPADVTESMLTGISAAYRGGVNDALLTALALAVRQWRSRRGVHSDSLVIDLEGHGREEEAVGGADLSRTVGWFTSLYPVALDLTGIDLDDAFAGGPAAGAAFKAVKEQLRAVPDNGIGFGVLAHSGARTFPALESYEGAQIGFNYLGRVAAGQDDDDDSAVAHGWQRATDGGGSVAGAQDPGMVVPAVLSINAVTTDHADGPRLSAAFGYAGGILARDEVRELAELWVAAAAALASHGRGDRAGGLTPSDVPLVRIDQSEIEELERDYEVVHDIWPLSPLQIGMLFHAEVAGQYVTDVYTAQVVLELRGAVDEQRLRAAMTTLVRRNPNLRAGFRHIGDGSVVQVIAGDVDIPWESIDLTEHYRIDSAAADHEVDRLLRAHRSDRFDMAAPPLIRALLLRIDPAADGTPRYRISITNHHILLDGWSGPLLMEQLFTLYATGGDDTHLPRTRSYRDFLAWLDRRDMTTAVSSWQQALEGLDSATLLVDDPAVESARDQTPVELGIDIGRRTAEGLADLSRDRGITMNTLVQAAWGLVLARSLGSGDVAFGATVSGRPPEISGVESILGLFINTIPVRVRLDESETVLGLLERIQSEQAGLLDAHHVGLPTIQRAVGLPALFDTLAVFESYPVDRGKLDAQSDIDGMSIAGAQINDASHYPATLLAQADPDLSLKLKYLPSLVPDGRAEVLADRLVRVLDTFAQAGWTPVRELDLLDADELHAQLDTWNATRRDIADRTAMDLFADQVAATPDAIAFVDGARALTYAQFDALSNKRARALIARGVGPDCVVGVGMSRSLEQMATVYGILKAGGAYLPLDVEAPDERLRTIVADADVTCVVADTSQLGRLRSVLTGVTCLDPTAADLQTIGDSPIRPAELRGTVRSRSLAYVLFTSGSTGRPKGVQITHRALVNQLQWIATEHGFGTDDVVLLKTPFTFDASVWEMFAPAIVGARTVIAGPQAHRDPDELVSLVEHHAVTVVQFVPSVLAVFAESASPGALSTLRTVFSGGEALPMSLAHRLADLAGAQVVNLYGPTEVTVDATSQVVAVADSAGESNGHVAGVQAAPIGRPVWNTRGFVLDRWLRLCAVGAVGELYLSGEQLARGYLGRPDLTAERFLPSVFGPAGSLMYRTGDRVRRLPDGTLQYLGRVDFQVKVRGLRIELEEIEAALAQHDSVAQAAVVMHEDAGRQRLVGYVTGRGVQPHVVREFATRTLAPYMVPEVIVPLDEFPRSRSGKIARRELPLPEAVATTGRPPATPTEEMLCRIVGELVGVDTVGADDSFFELGGDSILAMQLVSRARSAGLHFTARDVLEHRTVVALAGVVDSASSTPVMATPVSGDPTLAPLSPAAARMLERGGDTSRFVMPMVVNLPRDVTIDEIAATMGAVIDIHDVLRSRLDVHASALVIGTPGSVDVRSLIRRVELTVGTSPGEPGYQHALRDALFAEMDHLSPEDGVMQRFVWLDPGPGVAGRLLIVAHHLVVDAVSWRILVADIATAGSQVSAGAPVELPGTGTSWREWTAGQHQQVAARRDEVAYWAELLDIEDSNLGSRRLDLTRDRTDLLTRTEVQIPADVVEPLIAATGDEVTMADHLVAGLSAAVVGWRRDRGIEAPSVLLTLEGHGRQEDVVPGADLSRTVGWFTSMFPARIDLTGIATEELFDRPEIARDVLARTREAMASNPDRGVGYGMLRYLDPEAKETLGRLAEPQIVFNYIGTVPGGDVPDEIADAPWFPDVSGPKLGSTDGEVMARGNRMPAQAEIDIQSMTTATADGMVVRAFVSYIAEVIDPEDLDELIEHWLMALRALAAS